MLEDILKKAKSSHFESALRNAICRLKHAKKTKKD